MGNLAARFYGDIWGVAKFAAGLCVSCEPIGLFVSAVLRASRGTLCDWFRTATNGSGCLFPRGRANRWSAVGLGSCEPRSRRFVPAALRASRGTFLDCFCPTYEIVGVCIPQDFAILIRKIFGFYPARFLDFIQQDFLILFRRILK